jgi:hypothetical protein
MEKIVLARAISKSTDNPYSLASTAPADSTAPSIDVSTVGTVEELLSLIPINNLDITSLLTMTFNKMKELQNKI